MKSAKTFILLLICNYSIAQTLVEKYYRGGFHNSGTIELYDDGTFIEKSGAMSCLANPNGGKRIMLREVHGEYSLRKNHLSFLPKYKLFKSYEDEEIQKSNEYVKEEGFFSFSYDVIEYKNLKLLIAIKKRVEYTRLSLRLDNQYIYLANKLNEINNSVTFDQEFWRNKEFKNNESLLVEKDIKQLFPDGYKDYILSTPIIGKVKKIEEVVFLNPDQEVNTDWKKYKITLDIGKSNGVRPKMILYGKKACNGVRCSIIVEDVFENECSGYIQNYSPQYNCSLEKQFSSKK